MLPARNTQDVTSRRRPTSTRPPPPQRLPNLDVGPTNEESTAVVETPTMEPRKTPSGVPTLMGFAPIVKIKTNAPPPLPARKVALASSETTGIVTPEMFIEAEQEAEALAPVLPMTPSARAFALIATVAVFFACATVAAARWARRTAPRGGARALAGAKLLTMEARRRLHVEWARASARSRRSRA
jgi:hypothetical protein